jgi:hypothetical protein
MNTSKTEIEAFIDEIREAIAETLEDWPNAPETDVTREVVQNMLLGEDSATRKVVLERFGL